MATSPWSDEEIKKTVDVYFQMLTLELAGESYTKAEFRRDAERVVQRSPAAIEYKFSNISAVLDELGAVWIPGFKPLRNVQSRLRELVTDGFHADTELRAFMLRAVEDPDVALAELGGQVDPPAADWPGRPSDRSGSLGIDFAAVESANRALGLAGELSVMRAEKARLQAGGREDLANEVRHVAITDGDGLGYDIRSFHELTEAPVYLEVKTTRYGKEVPFYLTENELAASNEIGPDYRLLRLYRYGSRDSGFYRLLGPLGRTAQLRPDTYRGLPAVTSTD
ncbi:DUF3883 domain-containing protein [Nocardioides sp. T5]|uniref:DUF3883 domain-containing protein n=1 Tax=Nocardioides sp. T5 TaxID=3400182 RepID=UPI003A891827